jgi:hypothetical protein
MNKGHEVFLVKRNKPFFISIVLLAATAASGAPTVTIDNSIAPTLQIVSDTRTVIVPTEEVVGAVDAKLANLGREFLRPPAGFAVLGDSHSNNVKPLPAVPAAIFMVLSGFLCISLVRDRRTWLAALTGLLWAGQTGIQVIPQLAHQLIYRNHSQQQLSAELAYPHYLENSHRLRSDIEGTPYIGLLRHLAGIPDAESRYLHKVIHTYTSQHAVVFSQTGLNPLLVCLVPKAEQLISFSPAFIFANLPRGPPIQA